MCNWSEDIKEMSYNEGIGKGIEKERLNAIERMIQANLTKAQIISCGYTEEEFAEAESLLYTNAQEFVTTEHKTVARGTLGM